MPDGQKASPAIPMLGLVVGVALALVAQFLLDHLADTSDAWHQLQHGTIFIAGILAGVSLAILYTRGQRPA